MLTDKERVFFDKYYLKILICDYIMRLHDTLVMATFFKKICLKHF